MKPRSRSAIPSTRDAAGGPAAGSSPTLGSIPGPPSSLADAGTWSWEVATNQSQWDDRFHGMHGFKASAPRNFESWMARVHPGDRDRLRREIERLIVPGGPELWHQRFRILHPAKGERWMEAVGRVERDASGRAVRFAGVNLDITEQERIQRALHESEEKYRHLHESVLDAFASTDLAGRFTDTNRAFQEMTGYSARELLGLTYARITPAKWHESDASVVMAQVWREGCSDPCEKEFRRRDGSVLPVEVRVFLLRDEHGLAVGTWAVARDITRRKIAQRALAEARDTLESRVAERTAELERANAALRASEERYRSLVDNLDVGVFRRSLTGPSTDRLHGNPALARMFGHGSLAEMARRPRAAFFRSAAEYREFSSNLLRRGALHDYQVRLRRRDHSLFWGSITAAVHRDFRGRADWIDAIVEDISDRRRAEAFLEIQRDLGVRLSLAGEMDAALKHLLEVVTGIEGVGSAAVYLAGEVGPGLELAASRGTTGRPAALPAAVLVRGACGRALQHGRPVFGACEGLEFSDGARPRRTPPRFAALLPLRHEEQLIGVLLVGAGTGGAVPESTRMTLEMVSTQASGAMARIQAEAGRRRLEKQILEISDHEQARLGQEIHDGLCQQLVGLAMDANLLESEVAPAGNGALRIARRMAGQLDRAISESRQVARGLFPIRLQRDGLRPALEELARSVTQRFGIRCSFRTRGPIKGVDPALGTHFYRIAQEAASNAVRHGHPARISILLRGRASGVELVVTDDGIGLPARSRHKEAGMGLHIMHYRARSIGGTLTIQPARPRGTVVSCRAPLAAPPPGG